MVETFAQLKWVHSKAMLVDGMTKLGSTDAKKTTLQLAESSQCKSNHDDHFTAAKRCSQVNRSDDLNKDENETIGRTIMVPTMQAKENEERNISREPSSDSHVQF